MASLTCASTGSSVYLVATSPQDICLAWGNDGQIKVGEVIEQQLRVLEVDLEHLLDRKSP